MLTKNWNEIILGESSIFFINQQRRNNKEIENNKLFWCVLKSFLFSSKNINCVLLKRGKLFNRYEFPFLNIKICSLVNLELLLLSFFEDKIKILQLGTLLIGKS